MDLAKAEAKPSSTDAALDKLVALRLGIYCFGDSLCLRCSWFACAFCF